MGKLIDLTGQKFNDWTVIDGSKAEKAVCRCICGIVRKVSKGALKNNGTLSCGCYRDRLITTHGMSQTKIYNVWAAMVDRCTKPRISSYSYYGGRGIKVCDKWLSFEGFWKDMGAEFKKGLTLDRINNDGNYCKENCRWTTRQEQVRNRRNTIWITISGETKTRAEWARKLGMHPNKLAYRLKHGIAI